MINIDFLTLKAFLTENIDFLIGARIQKIQQPTRRDFIFSLRSNFESKKLYINIDTNIKTIHISLGVVMKCSFHTPPSTFIGMNIFPCLSVYSARLLVFAILTTP